MQMYRYAKNLSADILLWIISANESSQVRCEINITLNWSRCKVLSHKTDQNHKVLIDYITCSGHMKHLHKVSYQQVAKTTLALLSDVLCE